MILQASVNEPYSDPDPHDERPRVIFPGGAGYCPVIGDDNGAGVPVRTGIQTSPPGYETRPHSHPYVELLTVLEGEGEAWVEGGERSDQDGARRDDCTVV